jgi:hypothetical protein
MGSRPSPPLATIYYGIRKEAVLLQDFTTNLLDYARFIDNGIGLWDTGNVSPRQSMPGDLSPGLSAR